jgi:2-desacetyl-2-hydroxyethyl bacteriochlorophyllide A dehydrogenase
MLATYVTNRGRLELREVPSPRSVAGTVLVRVHACGICGTDLQYYGGDAPPPRVCLGHEIAGRVATSAGTLARDTPVVVEPLIACGRCARCRAREPNLCPQLRILGSMAPGGLTELVVAPRQALYPVPPGLDLETAALAEPLAVGVHAAHIAAIGPRDAILVLGAGTIGLLAAFAAAARGGRVTVSARHPHQAEAARALGIGVVGTAQEEILARFDGAPPDVVLETVGGLAATLDLALRVVRPGGRIVALGKFTRPITLPPLRFLMKEVHLTSSMTYCHRGARPDFEIALALLARAAPQLAPLITHRVALTDVERGFALAADKTSGAIKVVVVPDATGAS